MLYKYLSEIIIGQVLNPFKGYLNLFKDLSKLFEYKTTSFESSYIWKHNYCFAELVVFVLGFHITVISYIPTYIHIHIHIHTSHSFNHLLILIHYTVTCIHTPHTTLLIRTSPTRQHEAANFDLFHWCEYYCLNIVALVYCSIL